MKRGTRMSKPEVGLMMDNIKTAVAAYQVDETVRLTTRAMDAGLSMKEVRQAICEGLNTLRMKLMSNHTSLPEFLLCIDAAKQGLAKLSEFGDAGDKGALTIVIGVVEGDPHDLGKSIISSIYRAFGYRVVDLGVQVKADAFERAVVENKADILALSAMMSTTMVCMPDIIRTVKQTCPGTVIMVGGAPLDRQLAEKYGADGYAKSAATVLEETETALGKNTRGNA
jgi:methylmalonyl-CoA mutase cobalamin-binding domain/chain